MIEDRAHDLTSPVAIVAREHGIDRHDIQIVSAKSGIDRLGFVKRLQKQAGADQKKKRDGDLRNHEQTAQIDACDCAASCGCTLAQSLSEIPPRGLQCWRQSKYGAAQNGDNKRKNEDSPIWLRIQVNRKWKRRKQSDQDITETIGKNHSTDAAEKTK